MTRAAYIKNDRVDPQSLAAMQVLESAVCSQHAGDVNQPPEDVQLKS